MIQKALRTCKIFRFLLFSALCLATISPLFAETILLRNGTSITGPILQQSRFTVTVQSPGGPVSINKTEILRIIYGNSELERQRQEAEKKREADQKQEELRKQQETSDRPSPSRSEAAPWLSGGRFAAAGKSALLPGWGQMSEGRSTAAIVYGGIFFGLAAILFGENRRLASLKGDYSSAAQTSLLFTPAIFQQINPGSITDSQAFAVNLLTGGHTANQRQQVSRANQLVKIGAYTLAGVYLVNIFDAYFYYKGGLGVSLNGGSLSLAYRIEF